MKFIPLPAPLDTSRPTTLQFTRDESFGSAPCRRCLTDAKLNDKVLLVSYNHFLPDRRGTPYSGPGPIFVHAEDCHYEPVKVQGRDSIGDDDGDDDGVVEWEEETPDQLRKRVLSVRAFDKGDVMVWSGVVDGKELKGKAEEVFGTDGKGVEYIHVHYAGAGCFAVKIEK